MAYIKLIRGTAPWVCVLLQYVASAKTHKRRNEPTSKGALPKYTGPATDRPVLYSLITNIRASYLVYDVTFDATKLYMKL